MNDPRDQYESPRPTLRLVARGAEPRRLLMDLYGPSGCGKTRSALEIAAGIVAEMGGKIAMIDTEGRGNLYERKFEFDRYVMEPPFSPDAFMAAYEQLDAQYGVIVTDTISDEYEGIGGLQEMAEGQNVKNDVAKWAAPKAKHRKLMARVRQLKAQHIFCVRAEDKIEIVEGEDANGRIKKLVRPLGWTRVAEKKWKYDMTVGLRFEPGARGVCIVDKMIEDLEPALRTGELVTEAFGRALAKWAKGEEPEKPAPAARTIPLYDESGTVAGNYPNATDWLARLEIDAQRFPGLITANWEMLTRIATSAKTPADVRERAERLRETAERDAQQREHEDAA